VAQPLDGEEAHRIPARVVVARDGSGQPAEPHREYEDEQQADPEGRKRESQDRSRDGLILERLPATSSSPRLPC